MHLNALGSARSTLATDSKDPKKANMGAASGASATFSPAATQRLQTEGMREQSDEDADLDEAAPELPTNAAELDFLADEDAFIADLPEDSENEHIEPPSSAQPEAGPSRTTKRVLATGASDEELPSLDQLHEAKRQKKENRPVQRGSVGKGKGRAIEVEDDTCSPPKTAYARKSIRTDASAVFVSAPAPSAASFKVPFKQGQDPKESTRLKPATMASCECPLHPMHITDAALVQQQLIRLHPARFDCSLQDQRIQSRSKQVCAKRPSSVSTSISAALFCSNMD